MPWKVGCARNAKPQGKKTKWDSDARWRGAGERRGRMFSRCRVTVFIEVVPLSPFSQENGGGVTAVRRVVKREEAGQLFQAP